MSLSFTGRPMVYLRDGGRLSTVIVCTCMRGVTRHDSRPATAHTTMTVCLSLVFASIGTVEST